MELVSWAFSDVDDMKRFLNITGDTQNDLLVNLINGSSSFMEMQTRRRLIAADYDSATDKANCWVDGNNSKIVFLKQYPINSVSSVVVSGATISAAEATDYYGSTGYVIYSDRGILFYDNGFDTGIQNVRVSYNAGYAKTTREYYELQELCRSLVSRVYNTRDKLGFKSETLMNYQYTMADIKAWDKAGNIQVVLNRYKRKITR